MATRFPSTCSLKGGVKPDTGAVLAAAPPTRPRSKWRACCPGHRVTFILDVLLIDIDIDIMIMREVDVVGGRGRTNEAAAAAGI